MVLASTMEGPMVNVIFTFLGQLFILGETFDRNHFKTK